MNEEILYTPEELAGKLKLSKYTIYEMIKRGDISAHHIGRSIRISDKQLEAYFMSINNIENVFNVEICEEGADQFVSIQKVKIYISSNIEGSAKILIRPEDIILSKEIFVSSARNMLKGIVTDIMADELWVKVSLDVGFPLTAYITHSSLNKMSIKKGDILYAVFKAMAVVVKK